MFRFWLKTAFLFFIIGGLMGLLMRMAAVFPLDEMDFGFMRQGHSHVAFLGWGYLALMVLLIRAFLPERTLGLKKYKWNLGFTALSIAGMIFSFPLTGYKLVSIVLLMLFLLASCLLVFHFLIDFRKTNPTGVSKSFVRAAFFFYLLSGIGPVALGPIVILYGKTPVYYLAVYYYLHFLYNGFFVFAIFGLLMKYIEDNVMTEGGLTIRGARKFFLWSFIACIPAYALSALWMQPHWVVYLIGGVAALLQLAGLIYFLPYIRLTLGKFSGLVKFLFSVSIISFGIKLLMQLFSALPLLALKTYQAKSFVVIGYLHLVVLGFISTFLLAWILKSGAFRLHNMLARLAVWLFFFGVLGSEVLLFSKGLLQWLTKRGMLHFQESLLVFSTLILTGLLLLWLAQTQKPKT